MAFINNSKCSLYLINIALYGSISESFLDRLLCGSSNLVRCFDVAVSVWCSG